MPLIAWTRLKIGRYSLVRVMCIVGLDALSDGEVAAALSAMQE